MNYLGSVVNPRVGQLDASLLDSELIGQLKDKLFDAFKFWRPEIKDKYDSELMAILKLLLFKVTVWDHATTYGAKLQSLALVRSSTGRPIGRKTRALYGCITILGSYAWLKIREKGLLSIQVIERLSFVWLSASLFNFVSFLYSGSYSTLVLRLLGVKFASVHRKTVRNVNYEFQNRQLIWNALTEFLLFALPLVNFRKMQRSFVKRAGASQKGSLSFLPRKTCAICYEQDPAIAAKGVTNPYTAGCEHPYCFVCLSLRLAEDPEWNCSRCDKKLSRSELKPYANRTEAQK